MSIGIYLIQNKINKKCYVGQSLHIEKRWIEHKNSIHYGKNTILVQAIRKYGWENFQCSIIEETSADLLDDREKYWIQYYNSLTPNGYNIQLGGEGSNMVCPEEILEIQNLLENSRVSMEEIAREYFISLRSVIRINQGDVWVNENKTYPLRKRLPRQHGDGKDICPLCGKPKCKDANYCMECSSKMQRKVERPSKEQLLEEIANSTFLAVGKKYGVSDKAIVKWCASYGLPTHKKDLVSLYKEINK